MLNLCSTITGFLVVLLSDHALTSCPTNWLVHGDSCYLFSSDKLDWSSARDKCFTFSGGHLADVTTKAEGDYLEAIARTLTSSIHGFWLDGLDEAEGVWVWQTSGIPFSNTYTDWAPGEPNNQNNEDCAQLDRGKGYHWNDFGCTHPQHYICEMKYVK